MRRNAKKDVNQTEIVNQLRDIPGVSVAITHRLGGGFPDIVIGYKNHNLLVELKSEGGKLNEAEEKFSDSWRGAYRIAFDVDPIIQWINSIK